MIHLRNPDEATVRRAVIDILSTVRNRSALAGKLGVHRTTLQRMLKKLAIDAEEYRSD